MEEFKENDDDVSQEHERGEKEEKNHHHSLYNNDFQLGDPKFENVFIEEKDLALGNYSARTEPSVRTKQMPNPEAKYEPNLAIVSTAKRDRIFNSESEKNSKRLKGLHSESFSFMNWITSITNGLNRSHDGDEMKYIGASHETKGFRSIFEALYHTDNDVRSNKSEHQKEIYALKGTEGEKRSNVGSSLLHNSNFQTSNVAVGVHSKRFGKEISIVESSSSAAMENLWITRLSPVVSSPQHKIPLWKPKKMKLNENYKSKLQLTVSSSCCKRSKLMASSSAQKNKNCLFCVDETKLDQFQMKSISFYDSFKKTRKKHGIQKKNHLLQGLNESNVSEQEDEIPQKSSKIEIVVCDDLQKSSFYLENGLKKSESVVMDEPKGMFVAVKKLRLSRKDVMRWMKSRGSHYNIGGFFLRLRIGKLKRGFGGTGYYVACINDASCQSSITVRVRGATYRVTSPFISNDDFNEDELMAWWFQNLRDGTKMPSYEELNEKLNFRLKFGL